MNLGSLLPYAVLFVLLTAAHVLWARYRIRQWGERNNYEITRCKLRLANVGPFSYFGTSGGQYIFRIEARSARGEIRTVMRVPEVSFSGCLESALR